MCLSSGRMNLYLVVMLSTLEKGRITYTEHDNDETPAAVTSVGNHTLKC